MKAKMLAAVVVGFLAGPMAADADTIVFDTMDGYAQSTLDTLVGYAGPSYGTYVAGEQFTSTASGYIDNLTLDLFDASVPGSIGPSGKSIQFGVFADNGGTVGSLIEMLSVTMNGGLGTVATGSYESGALLNAGQSYWIVSQDTALAQWWSESMTGPGVVTPSASIVENQYPDLEQPSGLNGGLNRGGFYEQSNPLGMIVGVAAASADVPEPATLGLLALGIAGVGLMKRRKAA
jgi:hypothetical protein